MASQLESVDAPVTTTDSTSGSAALIHEVNNDRAAANLTKPADQTAENKINNTFGSLTIVGDDAKDSTGTKSASDTTATAGTDTTAAPKAVADDKISAGAAAPADATAKVDATAAGPDLATTPVDASTLPAADGKPTAADAVVAAAVTKTDFSSDMTSAPVDTPNQSPNENQAKGDGIADAKGDAPSKPNGDGTRDVAKSPDATDVNADALKKIQDDPQVKAEQKKLNDDITKQEKGIDPKSDDYQRLETMRGNMDKLMLRGAADHPPLPPEEIAKTFQGTRQILEAKDGPNVLPKADRVDIAEQAMLHAADPTTIDQGKHVTCQTATVENRMFSQHPGAAVNLIEQVATTGKYTTKDQNGKDVTVDVPQSSLDRSGKEEKKGIPDDGDRSYASEIFQVTAVNLSHATHDLVIKDKDGKTIQDYPPGSVEFRQGKRDESVNPPTTGEGLFDKKTGQPIKDANGNPILAPTMDDDHIVDNYNMIAGTKDSGFYICNKDSIVGDGKQVTQIGSEAELKQKIQDAQRDGKMPILLGVNSGAEPFYSDNKGGEAGGSGGGHVISITGLDSAGNPVIENQWGKISKHSVDWHELYVATMTPKDAIGQLKQDVAQNVKDHAADPNKPVDYATQAELLRMRHASGDLAGNDKEYDQQLEWITKNAVKDAITNHNGILGRETEQELKGQFNQIANDNPAEFNALKNRVEGGQMIGIANGTGNVGYDQMGNKADLSPNYNTSQMEEAAKNLFDAGDQTFYFNKADYKKMDDALANKSPAEIKQMDDEFKKAHKGQSMEDYIKDRFSNHPQERDKALKLLHQAQTGNDQAAA